MVSLNSAEPWPNALDLTVTLCFVTIFLALPALGFVFMAVDLRRHFRSLRRSLALVSRRIYGIPDWARDDTPRAIKALGLYIGCTEDDLKRAYRNLVKSVHPDHGGDERRFLLLQAHFEEALAIVSSQSSQRR